MAVGVLSAVLAAACYECGYVLQARRGALGAGRGCPAPVAAHAAGRAKALAGRHRLTLLGAGFQIVALALAPVTLVQPVLALGLVALLLLARSQLGEQVGALEVAGAAAVIAGVAAVGIASPGRTSGVTSVPALVLLLAPLAALTLLRVRSAPRRAARPRRGRGGGRRRAGGRGAQAHRQRRGRSAGPAWRCSPRPELRPPAGSR